jgi:hypothetical protein
VGSTWIGVATTRELLPAVRGQNFHPQPEEVLAITMARVMIGEKYAPCLDSMGRRGLHRVEIQCAWVMVERLTFTPREW